LGLLDLLLEDPGTLGSVDATDSDTPEEGGPGFFRNRSGIPESSTPFALLIPVRPVIPVIPVIPVKPVIPLIPLIPVMPLIPDRILKGGDGGGDPRLLGGGCDGGGGRRSAQLRIASLGGGFSTFFLRLPQLDVVLQLRSLRGGLGGLTAGLSLNGVAFSFSASSSLLFDISSLSSKFISRCVSFSTASYVGGGSAWKVEDAGVVPLLAMSNAWILSLGLVLSLLIESFGVWLGSLDWDDGLSGRVLAFFLSMNCWVGVRNDVC
jgi:hypothetical protein